MEGAGRLVEITHVDLAEADETSIRDARSGTRNRASGPAYAGTYTFEVLGWVVGAQSPAVQVTLALDGTPLGERPVADAAPGGRRDVPRRARRGAPRLLPGRQRAAAARRIRAAPDRRRSAGRAATQRAPLATIAGRRAPLRSGIEPGSTR